MQVRKKMINKIIRNFIAKMVAGRSDDGIMITLKDPQKVEFQTAMMQDLLMRRGIDPNAIQSEAQLKMIINQIKAMEKAEDAAQSGIRNTESAKIFNRMGEELDPNQPIVGGTQPGKSIDQDTFRRLAETNTQRIKQKIADKKIDDDDFDLEKGLNDLDEFNVTKDAAKAKQLIDDKQVVDVEGTVKNITSMEPVEAMKEANKVIRREGKYKNLSQEDSKKILTDSEDWIFQRDPDDLYDYKNKRPFRDDPNFDPDDPDFNPENMAQGGRAGFFMGSANPKGLGLLKSLLNYFGKKSDVIKNPSDVLRISNPKAFNKMLEDAKGKVMPKEGIMATDAIKNYQTQMAKDRVDTVREMLQRGKRFKTADDKIVSYKNEVKEKFMRELNMSEEAAEKAANNMATLAMDVTKMEKTPEITEEGILQLENVLKNMETGGKKKRELNATGGRIGFDKGGMTRRTFLKLLGGLAAIPIVGKFLKPIKTAKGIKSVPIIKTDNVAGKPEWFDALVNKVIIEGDDVTKKFATAERQSIHQKTLDDGSVVRVTEDVDDGAVRVEYESVDNMYEDPVQMQYKKPLPDEGDPRPTAEFEVAESGPVGRAQGPDDFDIDVDEVGGSNISDLESDVSKLKQYATGKGPTMKEIVEIKKRKDKVKSITTDSASEADYLETRYGPGPEPDEFASGGIARMLGE